MSRRFLVCFALPLTLACGSSGDPNESSSSGASTTGDSASATDGSASASTTATTTTGDPTGTSGTTTTSTTGATDSGETAGSTGTVFVMDPDGGAGNECDPQKQDCPDGEKCTAWANDGGNSWNANKCVPVMGRGVHGDVCMTEGGGVSGLDDCAKGYICFNTDENMMGICQAFCDENENCPPGSQCAIQNDGTLPVCEAGCDPLLQDCPAGSGCYAVDGAEGETICMQDASGSGGADGEPCEFDNVCDPGLVCIGGSAGCMTTWCCTPWCDLTAPNTCPGAAQGEECVPHWPSPPPGYEDVGECVIPQ